MKTTANSKISTNIKNIVTYERALEITTDYLTENFSEIILELFSPNKESVKIRIKQEIQQFINNKGIKCEKISQNELIEKIYVDSFEFSFLNKYIFNSNVEEINCNGWDCIYVSFNDGRTIKLEEKFQNQEQALNIVKRLLRIGNKKIDDTQPIALSEIGGDRRITAIMPPIVDNEVGVSFSLRNVNSSEIDENTFLQSGSATKEMLDFIKAVIRYGIGACIGGGTSAGKTSLTDWVLDEMDTVNKRTVAIESGARELGKKKRKNYVSLLTKPNKNKDIDIDQDYLLAIALRYHPDIICVGEMRDKEAYTAQEAGRTGHTIITTVHADNSLDTYDRILSLCLKANAKIDDNRLFKYVVKAFPLIIYVKQLDDKSRRIMDILEGYIDEEGKFRHQSIFSYEIEKTEIINEKTVISGKHIRKNPISKYLKKRLIENGMPTEKLKEISGE